MRRTLVLVGLVALGAALLRAVPAPVRRTGYHALSGPRVLRVAPPRVQALEVALEGRGFNARRTPDGWEVDGRATPDVATEALDDLVAMLADLRAVDAFRPRDPGSYGLDHPRGSIGVATARRVRRLVLGDFNAGRSALYARRDGDRRVVLVGTLLLSAIERVFYVLGAPAGAGSERL